MAHIPRIIARASQGWSGVTEWAFMAIIIMFAVGMLMLLGWMIPLVLGYPFYLVYTKLFSFGVSPAESFWLTLALTYFVWLLTWFVKRLDSIIRGWFSESHSANCGFQSARRSLRVYTRMPRSCIFFHQAPLHLKNIAQKVLGLPEPNQWLPFFNFYLLDLVRQQLLHIH